MYLDNIIIQIHQLLISKNNICKLMWPEGLKGKLKKIESFMSSLIYTDSMVYNKLTMIMLL